MGPAKALDLIHKHKKIEKINDAIKGQHNIPDEWNYEEARELFFQINKNRKFRKEKYIIEQFLSNYMNKM